MAPLVAQSWWWWGEHWSAALAQPGGLWCDSSPALPHLLLFVGWAALFLGTLSDRPACHLPAAPSGPLASGRSSHTAGPSVCSCRGGCSSHASPQASPFLSGHPVTTSPFSVGTFVAGPSSVLHCSWAMYRLPCWGAGLVQTSNGDAPFGHWRVCTILITGGGSAAARVVPCVGAACRRSV